MQHTTSPHKYLTWASNNFSLFMNVDDQGLVPLFLTISCWNANSWILLIWSLLFLSIKFGFRVRLAFTLWWGYGGEVSWQSRISDPTGFLPFDSLDTLLRAKNTDYGRGGPYLLHQHESGTEIMMQCDDATTTWIRGSSSQLFTGTTLIQHKRLENTPSYGIGLWLVGHWTGNSSQFNYSFPVHCERSSGVVLA
jgi:hypothetical protein